MSYLCVDGGQTKTAVLLSNENGEPIHSWEAGPLTTLSKPGATDNLREVVRGVCKEARQSAELCSYGSLKAACFSLTGYLEGDEQIPALVQEETQRILPNIERVHTVPDYVGSWAAATRGEPGIIVISGGGAVAYGRNASGISLRVGGWGHLLGDEGSGYWIGLEATKTTLKSWAGLSPKTGLEDKIMEKLGAEDDRELLHRVYSGYFSDAEIAGLVPLVASLARSGDAPSARLLDEAAAHLARLAETTLERLGVLPVYLTGGVSRVPFVKEHFEKHLRETGHGAEVVTVSPDPLEGIFLVAREGHA